MDFYLDDLIDKLSDFDFELATINRRPALVKLTFKDPGRLRQRLIAFQMDEDGQNRIMLWHGSIHEMQLATLNPLYNLKSSPDWTCIVCPNLNQALVEAMPVLSTLRSLSRPDKVWIVEGTEPETVNAPPLPRFLDKAFARQAKNLSVMTGVHQSSRG